MKNQAENNLTDELAELFMRPLAEFTEARNALAARLKRDGRNAEATRVKALGKPSVSAWAVNQLYWKHRDAFDRLTAAGARFQEAQSSMLAGKKADLRGATEVRRAALSELSRLAASVLSDAGHAATPDKMLRITATLEAMSVYETLPNAATAGQLTQDIDPPGFESFASFEIPAKKLNSEKPSAVRIAEAKASLKDAERAVIQARSRVNNAETALKKAQAEFEEATQGLKDAELSAEQAFQALQNLK